MPRKQPSRSLPKRKRPEDALQKAVCELLAVYERQGHLRYFAIPNGGKRSKIEAAIMKGLGVRAGVPDLCVVFRDSTVAFLELKAPKGVTSDEQKDWLAWLGGVASHTTAVVRSADEVPYILGFQQRRVA